MLAHHLITMVLLQSALSTAVLWSSGKLVTRVESQQALRIETCFRGSEGRCLQPGQLTSAGVVRWIYLPLERLTSAHLTAEFSIADVNGNPIKKVVQELVVDSALPPVRIEASEGVWMEFFTVCARPFYGLMCSRKCVAPHDAHYVCLANGDKGCLQGWTGENCDIAIEHVEEVMHTPATAAPSYSSTRTERSSTKAPETSSTPVAATEASTFAMLMTSSPYIPKAQLTRRPAPLAALPVFPVHSFDVLYPSQPPTPSTTVASTSVHGASSTEKPTSTQTAAVTTHSAVPVLDCLLLLFLVAVLIGTSGYALVKLIRSPPVQNWVNGRRARVFVSSSIPLPIGRQKDVDTIPKVFVVDLKATASKRVYAEQSSPQRYSLQPRQGGECQKMISVADMSMIESHTYHEIDSFRVPPVEKERLATLV